MNGIDKIAQRIAQDAEDEIRRLREESSAQAKEVLTQAQAQADREREEILARGDRMARERRQRLLSGAQMDGRKEELAVKQALIQESFDRALQQLCAIPDETLIPLLAGLVVAASTTGKEQVIFSPKDRSRIGKQVVVAANDMLVKDRTPELPSALAESKAGPILEKVLSSATAHITGTGLLTLSEETRPIQGGFLLSLGDVEVNCAFETMLRVHRQALEQEVAQLLLR